MSDPRATIDRLVQKSNELPNGPQRIGLLEKAVALADQHGLGKVAFTTRLELMEAATFGGRPDVLLTAFAWCLAEHDKDPDRYEAGDLLWKYKWAMGNVVELPDVPRGQIEAMLADMESRFAQAGSTLHSVHQTRWEVLANMGDLTAAGRAIEQMKQTKRDWLSDCRACIFDVAAGKLAERGLDEEAVAEAAPILTGKVKCTHVPHRTYGKLLLPLLRLGRLDEAVTFHREGIRLIGENPEFLAAAANHLIFLTLTGNLEPATHVLQVYLPHAVETPSLLDRLEFHRAAQLLLEAMLEAEIDAFRLTLPATFPLFEADGTYEVARLHEWLATEASALAARFDARNGNDHYTRWLAELQELKTQAVDLPLDDEEF